MSTEINIYFSLVISRVRVEKGGCPPSSVSGLMLRKKLMRLIIELIVILSHLHVCALIFFMFLEKISSCCLKEASQSSKYCLLTLSNHKNCGSWVKINGTVMIYTGTLCDRMPMFTIPRRNCHQHAESCILWSFR